MKNSEDKTQAKQYQKIFIQWRELLKLSKRPEKKLLRHYLSTIEKITQNGFFQNISHRIAPSEYENIGKNTLPNLHEAYDETNSLIVEYGQHNKIFYRFPDTYPKSMKEWFTVEKGYLIIPRDELKYLLSNLSDNDLRVYFILKRIFEANGKPLTGVETWPKIIREYHSNFNITQNTLKKCIKSLEEKRVISTALPISKDSRIKNRFVFYIAQYQPKSDSQKLTPRFPVNDSEFEQIPENCVHIKEGAAVKEGIYINQEANSESHDKQKVDSGFNFYDLDKIPDPLNFGTVKLMSKELGLEICQIQESVMRFSRYYFSHKNIQDDIPRPIGFLRNRMRICKNIFIEPEWWLEMQHRPDLGKKRFDPTISTEQKLKDGRAWTKGYGNFFSDIIEEIEELGA